MILMGSLDNFREEPSLHFYLKLFVRSLKLAFTHTELRLIPHSLVYFLFYSYVVIKALSISLTPCMIYIETEQSKMLETH